MNIPFEQIAQLATTVSPMLATILFSMLATILVLRKEINGLKNRVDEYDKLNIRATLARIETDISWIRSKLEKRI